MSQTRKATAHRCTTVCEFTDCPVVAAVEQRVAALAPLHGAQASDMRGVRWTSHLNLASPKPRGGYYTISTVRGLGDRVRVIARSARQGGGWLLEVDGVQLGALPTKTAAHCIIERRVVGSFRYQA